MHHERVTFKHCLIERETERHEFVEAIAYLVQCHRPFPTEPLLALSVALLMAKLLTQYLMQLLLDFPCYNHTCRHRTLFRKGGAFARHSTDTTFPAPDTRCLTDDLSSDA